MGKDRLEAGRFALIYDPRAFTLKGDGRVAGAPVSIDMRQPKAGAARRGAGQPDPRRRPARPQGPADRAAALRHDPGPAVVPIGRPGTAKPPIRVEADLAKAGIDGLVPGLTKPPGKPGRLTFTLVDTGQTWTCATSPSMPGRPRRAAASRSARRAAWSGRT